MTVENSAAPASPAATPEDVAEVRALFMRQAQAENAHDMAEIDAVIAAEIPGFEDAPMFVARAGQFFGREAVLQRFRDNFSGTWKFEPEVEKIRVTPICAEAMHVSRRPGSRWASLARTLGPSCFSSTRSPSALSRVGVSLSSSRSPPNSSAGRPRSVPRTAYGG